MDKNGRYGHHGHKWTRFFWTGWTRAAGDIFCAWERLGVGGQTSITTGMVALPFKPQAIPSVEAATPIKIFVSFRVVRG
jgi:hypothetical protein